jgi:hypothetical protein
MNDAYKGPLGRLRKRWLDKANARMEADPEYQRLTAGLKSNQWSPELMRWETESGYLYPRPWYWNLYWKQQDLSYQFHKTMFYIRRHVLGIKRPNGYWHFTHAELLICPDCDYEGKWCSENVEGHACTAQILGMSDVHQNVKDGYLPKAECDQCGVSCP